MSRALQGTRLETGQESALAQTLLVFSVKQNKKLIASSYLMYCLAVFSTQAEMFSLCAKCELLDQISKKGPDRPSPTRFCSSVLFVPNFR